MSYSLAKLGYSGPVRDVLVLCYHAVSPTWDADVSVTPDALEQQLTHLARSGWKATTFTQAVLAPSNSRTVAVTFDDAFASVKNYAAPLLMSLGWPATVFTPTKYVSSGELIDWSGLEHWKVTAHAEEMKPMSWNELAELEDAGWEIGSHTCTHPRLTTLGAKELKNELEQSRAECTAHLRRACQAIAYPYGDADERVSAYARQIGYLTGAMVHERRDRSSTHRWPRVGIFYEDTPWRFRLKINRRVRRARSSRLWPQ